jgi:hypothetical protein
MSGRQIRSLMGMNSMKTAQTQNLRLLVWYGDQLTGTFYLHVDRLTAQCTQEKDLLEVTHKVEMEKLEADLQDLLVKKRDDEDTCKG